MDSIAHMELARRFMRDGAGLLANGSDRYAAEGMWGVMLETINALAHNKGEGHKGNAFGRVQIIAWAIANDIGSVSDWDRIALARDLHSHFYTGEMTAAECAARFSDAYGALSVALERLSAD